MRVKKLLAVEHINRKALQLNRSENAPVQLIEEQDQRKRHKFQTSRQAAQ